MFLKKLLKLIIKKGKKTIAMKTLTKTIRVLKPYLAPSELNIVFNKLAPLVKIYKKKVAGKVYQLPWYSTPKRTAFQTAKWIILGANSEKKTKKFSIKIGKQFLKTLNDTGLPLKLKGQFVEIIRENRSYMRFIRRKRFKKKRKKISKNKSKIFRKFRNRFTKKAFYQEIWEKKISKRKNFKKDVKNNSKKFITKNKKQRR